MERFASWWKAGHGPSAEKRYVTLMKAILLAALPLLCCVVSCAAQGRSIGEVYLPCSQWNDELFYFKQVEGIVNYGYPQGYFGFNESHALKLSFAAWSPVLVFPWILWGLLFGWNLMSPIICNILLMTAACFLFVWLAKPSWRQLGILALLFCLYPPFVRYMLSVMPEVICFSLLIVFYGLAIDYLQEESAGKLAALFALSGLLTLMRPYMLLFMLLPSYFWIRRKGWRGAAGSAAVLAAVLGLYALIKHYLGAEYFTPLFFTDWFTSFFERGFLGGIRYTFERLCTKGEEFIAHTKQGIRVGLASGAFFAGYLVCLCVLAGQSILDGLRLYAWHKEGPGQPDSREDGKTSEKIRQAKNRLVIEAHLAFSFIAMLFAHLLMYKMTEGSKHFLTFMAVALFVTALMETRYYKKAVLLGITFAYFYSYKAVEPYDYQIPFVEEERQAAMEEWGEAFSRLTALDRDAVPSYENVVIWVFNDMVEGEPANTPWQLLYRLPQGFGISCCMGDYVLENFHTLKSRYLVSPAGGEIEALCQEAGYTCLYSGRGMVLYELRPAQPARAIAVSP